MSYGFAGWGWAPRKSAAERRAEAERHIRDAARRGHAMSPVATAGRKIAHTFWGKAWCDNLERYRDFAYRLERGRSYLRSGSVIDLRIDPGRIAAKVSGSSLYDVAIDIDAVQRDAWRAIQRDCAGGIGSRIDLLTGKLSEPVMARLCADRTGLFPAPSAIRFRCSCPDHAIMCKHVAAAMYGVGARLDHAPELLFTLRRVSIDELLASAVTELPKAPSAGRILAAGGLGALFGIELAEGPAEPAAKPTAKSAAKPTSRARTRPSRAPRSPGDATAATPEPARRTRAGGSQKRARSAGPKPTKAARDLTSALRNAKARPSLRPLRARQPASPAAERASPSKRRAAPANKLASKTRRRSRP